MILEGRMFSATFTLLVVSLIAITSVKSLRCFNCLDIGTTSQCYTATPCASDELCYTERRYDTSMREYYTMGCLKSSFCQQTNGDIIVGKRQGFTTLDVGSVPTKREASCLKCCSTDECNRGLCESAVVPEITTTLSPLPPIRLTNGQVENQGRVEIYHDNTWGVVCDDTWSNVNAQIVCNQLGYKRPGATATVTSRFPSTQALKYWLDDVSCRGNELSIAYCTHPGWGVNNCSPGVEEAGVICIPNQFTLFPKDDVIFLLDTELQEIIKLNTVNQSYTTIPVDSVYRPQRFDYDANHDRIYFSEQRFNQILSMKSDGTDVRIVKQSDLNFQIGDLKVDPIRNILFYSDDSLDVIASVNTDGSHHRNVISSNLNIPNSIALDPRSQTIYWTDWGHQPKIESANYDGSNRRTLTSINLKWPSALNVDFNENRLYFIDSGKGTIESMEFHGNIRKVLLHDPAARFLSMDVFGDYIYFTALDRSAPMRIKKDGSGLSYLGPLNFNHLSGIQFYKYGTDYLGQPMPSGSLINPAEVFLRLIGQANALTGPVEIYAAGQWRKFCSESNWQHSEAGVVCSMLGMDRLRAQGGSASQTIALATSYLDYKGHCLGNESHFVQCGLNQENWNSTACASVSTVDCNPQSTAFVGEAGWSCDGPVYPHGLYKARLGFTIDNFLVFFNVSSGTIIRMDLNTFSYTTLAQTALVNSTTVVYNPRDKRIYFSQIDVIGNSVLLSTDPNVRDHNATVILNVPTDSVINGLAIDTERNLLFYTDAHYNRIVSISPNGSNMFTVVGNLNQPKFLAVDRLERTVYWTEWGAVPKIEKSNYDGSNRNILAIDGLRYPNGIAVDHLTLQVYFCDSGTYNIEVMSTDGTNRRVLLTDYSSHFFGLTITSNYIYYSDWNKRHVYRLNHDGTNHTPAGPADFNKVNGIYAYESSFS